MIEIFEEFNIKFNEYNFKFPTRDSGKNIKCALKQHLKIPNIECFNH